MLKEEKLDVFLDAFLDGKKPAQETDLDFWDEKSEPDVFLGRSQGSFVRRTT